MSVLSPEIPSVYTHFTEAEFRAELERVHHETEQDRAWIEQYELQSFATDKEILDAAALGQLERVTQGLGYTSIMRLMQWDEERSHPQHEYHYSPPYLVPLAHHVVRSIARDWQFDIGQSRQLSITSMTRSDLYQENLAKKSRKLTISYPGMKSSHQVGYAFDIDGCGLVETRDDGVPRQINPRAAQYQPGLVYESRTVLQSILDRFQADGVLHYVEELPGTQEHCFHVCVNPGISSL